MGLIKMIISIAIAVVVLLAAIGGIMYATDTPVKAVITDKECTAVPGGSTSAVTVTTKFPVPGVVYTLQDFDNNQCQILRAGEDGNYVEYHLKSGHIIFYEREGGACIYDSETGVAC